MSKECISPQTPEEFSKEGFSKEVGYYSIEYAYRELAGKILTIIDASIADKQHNKAVKDLIKREIRIEIDKWQKIYGNGRWGHSVELPEASQELI
jgi:hypothetical protein